MSKTISYMGLELETMEMGSITRGTSSAAAEMVLESTGGITGGNIKDFLTIIYLKEQDSCTMDMKNLVELF